MNLTPEQYWKWRYTISELQHSETKLKNCRSTHVAMEKDIEIQKLKSLLFKQTVKSYEDNVQEAKNEYEASKKMLEEMLGISLNSCVIDDVTFEIRKLDN